MSTRTYRYRTLAMIVTLLVLIECQTAASSAHAQDRAIGSTISKETNVLYPESPAIINVTKAPYFAKGDGVTDDTDAIQKALSDTMGLHRMLYFPNGTYLISKTLNWSKKNADGRDAWGRIFFRGRMLIAQSFA